ncbi:3-oxoacyl-[acyl-carrier protein] reductase [Bradyrhizobium macuxiense]|uniref:3-oxoacyl-[acyl-carrier protein] reductase n=1 Tax=Bradyrhizobium macuxiense TaxID=1755647 RepID=A0A560KWX9_9BRAD|nr:SDR family oxidoreductase [Bradyrhizobium macuxiense]TWB87743.1 3-oxoacyl-[acyl-carrier protein] reductase [Bradyrhizobium macuxiense]
MDLRISGRKAIVCASSQGLGLACAVALAQEGVQVVINGRNAEKLEAARETVAAASSDRACLTVVADITTDPGRAALIEACPDPDILVNNNAGPPPGRLENWDREAWIGAFDANMIPALLLMRSVIPGMRARKFGRIVNITSAMVKSPLYMMALSTAARTALTAACKAISRDVIEDNVTINNLLPERIDTPRQEFMARRLMDEKGITYDEARRRMADTIAARRFGRPEEFATACAFLCGVHAGFITGQNLQLDGGSYSGLI